MGICQENVSMCQFVTLAYLTHLQGKWRLVKIGENNELWRVETEREEGTFPDMPASGQEIKGIVNMNEL
jgi:hypothetical protein